MVTVNDIAILNPTPTIDEQNANIKHYIYNIGSAISNQTVVISGVAKKEYNVVSKLMNKGQKFHIEEKANNKVQEVAGLRDNSELKNTGEKILDGEFFIRSCWILNS